MIDFFQTQLLNWYKSHGRHDLPWQKQSSYHVWLSEIMLQQTQVATVIPYFIRFVERFPNVGQLALANEDEVFKLWAGLGYYHRAKNLMKTAVIIQNEYKGEFPKELETLKKLPGIGPSTAAAIASQAFDLPHAIFDGNVKRVLARFFGIEGIINEKQVLKTLEALAHQCMPNTECQAYTQAIMDMGATCCKIKNPNCNQCPLHIKCIAFLTQKTNSIPGRAKTLAKPVKRYDFVVYINQTHQVFMTQRPDKGIWPKLWSFPVLDTPKNNIGMIQTIHKLTHQTMDIHLHVEHIHNTPNVPGQWVKANTLDELALPKPFETIKTQIQALLV